MMTIRPAAAHADTEPDDSGIAMVVAIAVIMLVSAVVATFLVLAFRETNMSGRERQRAVAIASAEGQVDNLVSRIDQAAVSTLTAGALCGPIPEFTTQVGPDPLTINSSVTYYDVDQTPITDCNLVATGAVEAHTASIQATSTSDPLPNQPSAVRHFETVVNLDLNENLNQAIFGNLGVTITNNNTAVYGEAGANNGDVYSNGYVNCRGYIYGSVYAQTTVTLENECKWVAGNIQAIGNVVASSNNMTMVGDISSTSGTVSLGQLGAQANKVFNGKAYAPTVTGNVCPGPKCNSGQSPEPPRTAEYPQIAQTADWTAPVSAGGLGFVQLPTTFPCIADFNNPSSVGYWLEHNGPTLTQNTLIRMPDNCTVDFTNVNGHDMVLNKDVAIFARGLVPSATAFNITGAPEFVGTPGDVKNLYLIQDYQTPQCGKIGINLNNSLNVNENIRVLMYTPHTFYSSSGTSELTGQIFSACEVDINNVMDLTYSNVPAVGIINIGAMSYATEIVAKRETS